MSTSAPRPKLSLGRRIEKFLMKFFGPAQLGPLDTAQPTQPAVEPRCPRCGQPMSAHTYVETPQRRRLRCPDAEVSTE
jgi:hypothetical protein